ncbi:hypothetical protein [uncultured Imperialibacter sp.]|uniref:hypothetical protein n=1 Tax=uncultured Imperialibacter sp. TaxID=1672639 RepID=UPI0030D912F8|tara:strand:+ start:20976 stop:21197 length:222 start_codon:yes stop_codon:yes gene_type:complete
MDFSHTIQQYFKIKGEVKQTLEGNRYEDDEIEYLQTIYNLMEVSETDFEDTPKGVEKIESLIQEAREELIRIF